MISEEIIKIYLFTTRVKILWPKIKYNHRHIIDCFYHDFIDLLYDRDIESVIYNFLYAPSVGVLGVIIFDEIANIFYEHNLISRYNSNIALEISLNMITQKYHKRLNAIDLVVILNPLIKTSNLSHIYTCLQIIKSHNRWQTNYILIALYQKILRRMRLICNSKSILYIPSSNIFNKVLSKLSLGLTSNKFVNRLDLLFHPIYNSIMSYVNSDKVTLEYSEGIDSSILLYFLWLARQNKIIRNLYVAYIKDSSRKLSESFIINLCNVNKIPLRIRTITEKGIISRFKHDYLIQTKLDILSDLGYPIISSLEWNQNNFYRPLKFFSKSDKLMFVKKYKIPYYKVNEIKCT